MNTHQHRLQQYLAHAENRIHLCQANYALFDAKDDDWLAEEARLGIYNWIGKAQDLHQEDHF